MESKLDKLSIKGFKSFSRLTSLLFSSGITAIVGPNGSGKSNVLDAVSFVMGSLSFSSLRAKSAESLRHFGKTKKSNEAEVKLDLIIPKTISNEGKLKLSRKLNSDGTSVYKINSKRSTRLNLIDSLASINIFPDSHNIVRQGDITKFVNMTPRERRGLIEVVAGIELYEKKKQKALTDLENVENKIQKVEAIHGERMRVFEKLKQEKKNVERFHHLKSLEERARFSLLLKRIKNLKETSEKYKEEREEKEEEIEKIENSVMNFSKELNDLNLAMEERGMKKRVDALTKLEKAKMDLQRIKEEEMRTLKDVESTQNRLSSIQSQITGLSKREKELSNEIVEKQKRQISLEKEKSEYTKHKESLTSKVAKARQDFEKRKNEFLRLKNKKEKLVLSLKERSLEKDSLERIITELEKKLDVTEKRRISLEAQKKIFVEEQKKFENESVKVEKDLKDLIKKIILLKEKETQVIYSSNLPAGARKLKNKGFKLLGELVSDPNKIMPFAFSVVANKAQMKKIEDEIKGGWAFIIPDNFKQEKIEKMATLGKSIGKLTKYEFEGETKKNLELEKIKTEIKNSEKEVDKLRSRRAYLNSKLERAFDRYQISEISQKIKETKQELSQRKKELKKLLEIIKEINNKIFEIGEIKEPTILEEKRLEKISLKVSSLESEKLTISSEIKANEDTLKNLIKPDILNYQKLEKELIEEIKIKREFIRGHKNKKIVNENEIKKYQQNIKELENLLKDDLIKKTELEGIIQKNNSNIYQLKADITILNERIDNLLKDLISLEKAKPFGLETIENPKQILTEVLLEFEKLGDLNFKASDEFENIFKLVQDISEKLRKLRNEKDAILELMNEIENQKKKVFMETFTKINEKFKKTFSEIIDGQSSLELDKENPFESGVYIKAIVHGRNLPSESLSGGQKTLAAIALIFAIQEVKPSPFYIFDEVETALDKPNIEKFAKMLKKMSKTTQIIIITHNDVVVREANQIIGVYMGKSGSKLISLPKEKVLAEAESWIGNEKKEIPQ